MLHKLQKLFVCCLLLVPFFVVISREISAAEKYFKGIVQQIESEQTTSIEGKDFYIQQVMVKNSDTGQVTSISYGNEYQPVTESQRLTVGQAVVVAASDAGENQITVGVTDRYRLPILGWLLAGFFLLVLLVAGKKGFFSVLGMGISLVVLLQYVVPQVLAGANPIVISMIAACIIAGITVYLSHGISIKSHIALASMMSTLLLVILLSESIVRAAFLTGLGSEEAAFLQVGQTMNINLQGLLLGGIMLGALGILDDITISQAAIVFELKQANKNLTFSELYQRGMNVGKDHVASLVNTLVLAYAGSNLPLFVLFVLGNDTPLWVRLNMEVIAEEVVRTLVGSMGLVLAVPITTLLAAFYISKNRDKSYELTYFAKATQDKGGTKHSH